MGKLRQSLSYKWMAMAVVAMETLMSTIDMAGIRVILPNLEQVFQTSPDVVVWVSLIWVLVGSSLMISMARVADIFGGKKQFTIGLAVFILGLFLCSLAQNITQLIIFRLIQSFGAAMTISIEYAIVTASFPPGERGRALGIVGAIAGLGLLSGPVIAGFCLDLFGWRSFFYLRVPLVVITLIMSQVMLKDDYIRENREKFDLPGAVTFFFALVFLVFALTQGQRLGWTSPWIVTTGSLGILFLSSFLIVERRRANPILDLGIFKSRLFSISVLGHILLYVSTVAVNFAMPFYLIDGLGYSASITGLLLITTPAIMLLLSPSSGKLSDRLGTFVLCASGFVLISLGLFLLSRVTIDTSIGAIILFPIIIGVGIGLFVSPNTSAIIGAVPSGSLRSASAMAGTLRHLGMSIGLAISGGVFTASRFSSASRLASLGESPEMVYKLSTVSGFRATIFVALIIALCGLLVSIFRGRVRSTADVQPSK